MIDIVQISTEGIKSIILYLKKNLFYENLSSILKKEDKEMSHFLFPRY